MIPDPRLAALLADRSVMESFVRFNLDETITGHFPEEAQEALVAAILSALDRSAPEMPQYRTIDFAEAKRLLEEMAPVVERACVALEQAKRITQKDLRSEVTI